MDKDFEKLVVMARGLAGRTILSEFANKGSVGCALMTDKGNIYTGVNLNVKSGIGFCAEHSAIAEMVKHNETRIIKIASSSQERVVPPCGRCREFIRKIDGRNADTLAMVDAETVLTIRELLPHMWQSELPE
ncbi:MAG: cytidine deaminase [Firmicutes bacterium]|nr:cytidine deaminase [Bacillota bacterium]